MTPDPTPLAVLNLRAATLLTREFGAAEALRFLDQFGTGRGDYTAEREQSLAGVTLEEIVAEIKASRRRPLLEAHTATGPSNSTEASPCESKTT